MATQYLKWNDPEYKRQYFRNYYHLHKTTKNIRRDIDWNDTDARKEYRKMMYNEQKEKLGKYFCETCRCEVNKINEHRHQQSQRHKNALVLLEKLKLLSLQ